MEYFQENLTDLLTEAISESFENLIFTEVEEVQELERLPVLQDTTVISVDTLAPFRKRIVMLIDNDFAEEIFTEMLGGDTENTTEEMIRDALGEIGNTVVGKFLSKAVPQDQEFSLGFPECQSYDPVADLFVACEKQKILQLDLEGNIMYVVLKERTD